MNYFLKGDSIHYYNDLQIQQGYAKGLTPLSQTELEEHLIPIPDPEDMARRIRQERDQLIEQIRWRVERHQDETLLGITPTEPLQPILEYIQALRDVPQQENFPHDVVWPTLPPEAPNA